MHKPGLVLKVQDRDSDAVALIEKCDTNIRVRFPYQTC